VPQRAAPDPAAPGEQMPLGDDEADDVGQPVMIGAQPQVGGAGVP
jgi:hypothetical protein